jgi:hypothetical protein
MRDAFAVRSGEGRKNLSGELENTLKWQRPGERLAVN